MMQSEPLKFGIEATATSLSQMLPAKAQSVEGSAGQVSMLFVSKHPSVVGEQDPGRLWTNRHQSPAHKQIQKGNKGILVLKLLDGDWDLPMGLSGAS